ncbi:Nucleoid occlusion factor SlmA [bioreactor metagenome]|uniref:Nucleoid occlusion factor SlmA n=1 Tax=bioreactor metagenome TaxID=1076179 RepID=A0A645CJX8_9ZZZZ
MSLTRRQYEIIDIALNLTAQRGIQSLTIKNLGQELGISEPAIYRHFKSKSEIVKAMIGSFDLAVPAESPALRGFAAVAEFIRGRLAQVAAKPALAKVMFAEELFMDEPEFTALMLEMMHRHKSSLQRHFAEAQEDGEIRRDLPGDMLFRLVFGPVRLLIKQWGMSDHGFDLVRKGEELLETFRTILKP